MAVDGAWHVVLRPAGPLVTSPTGALCRVPPSQQHDETGQNRDLPSLIGVSTGFVHDRLWSQLRHATAKPPTTGKQMPSPFPFIPI